MSFIPLLERAFALHQAGKIAEAEPLYQQVLQLEADQPDALHLLGVIAHQRGQLEPSVELIRRAIAKFNTNAAMHKNLGVVLMALKRYAEAEQAFTAAVTLHATDADTWQQLATVQRGQSRFSEAERSCREAIRLNPQLADAHDQLGMLVQARGGYAESETHFRQALAIAPQHVLARVHLAVSCSAGGRWAESQQLFREALRLEPKNLQALLGYGSMLHDQGLSAEGAAILEQAVALYPAHHGARAALGTVLEKVGRTVDARAHLEESIRLRPNDGVRLRLAMMPYIIAPSTAALQESWQRCEAQLTAIEAAPLSIANPLNEVGATPFFYAYQALPTRALFERMARVYRRASPRLTYTAPHCANPARSASKSAAPIRIGMVSKFFHDHPVGRFYLSLLRRLDRSAFHVTAFTMSHVDDEVSRSLPEAADQVVRLSPDFWTARDQIAQAELDVLIYTDIGMDPWTYYLAYARLALVQCVLPGHPITTGIDTLDYFISSRQMEPADGPSHYTEQLVTFESLPSCMPRPKMPVPIRSRGELGLPVEGRLYMTAQTVYKYHPAYDELYARILRADPEGKLVIFAGRIDEWTRLLKTRLQTALGDLFDRVVWLTRLSHSEYLEAITHADALLDTPAFNGGTTSVEAVAAGVPVVTLPGPFLRMRTTLGVYNAIGVLDTVARDADEFVALALRLANDKSWRGAVSDKIRAHSDRLFDANSQQFANELQQFLQTAMAERRG